MNDVQGAIIAAAVLSMPTGAHALCIYNGQDNAKTTAPQEFRDSRWVVRAKVLSAVDHFSDDDASWTTYEIKVQRAYKGHPKKQLRFFTFRDSGGFYMDRPWAALPTGHDVGGEYLLLNPIAPQADLPSAAKGAVFVNYNCGQSGPWTEVPALSRKALSGLEHRY